MKKEDIEHLSTLARIKLTDAEAVTLASDITNIVGYVSEINEIAGSDDSPENTGSHYNILREDENPHEGGIYTEAMLKAAPKRDGQYIEVKKILGDG